LFAILKTLLDNGVSPFADHKHFILRCAYDNSHSLACRVELKQVQKLILLYPVPRLANHIVVHVSLFKEKAEMPGTVDQGKLVGT
jgi:hypothetical protein